jgi:hypothetical protein
MHFAFARLPRRYAQPGPWFKVMGRTLKEVLSLPLEMLKCTLYRLVETGWLSRATP